MLDVIDNVHLDVVSLFYRKSIEFYIYDQLCTVVFKVISLSSL
jgi:hypothetical protein